MTRAPRWLALRAPGHARYSQWLFSGRQRVLHSPGKASGTGWVVGSPGEAVKLFATKLGNIGVGFLFPSPGLTFLKYIFFRFLKQKYSEGALMCSQKATCPPPENTCFKIFSGKREPFLIKAFLFMSSSSQRFGRNK